MTAPHGLRAWLGLAVLALAVAGCDRLPGRPDPAERWVAPDDVMDARQLLAENCQGCHGRVDRPGPARLLDDPLWLAVIGRDDFRRVVAEGVPGTLMPAFSGASGGWLTAEQIDALAEGLFASAPEPTLPHGVSLPPWSEREARAAGVAPGDPARGAQVYARYCADCHGRDGEGGPGGGSVVDGSYLALASDQGLRSAVIAGRIDLAMPAFDGYEGLPALGWQEISDVTAFMAAKRPDFPGSPYPLERAEAP